MDQVRQRVRSRKACGSGLAEVAPALFILLIAAVFPMLDLIFAGIGYCAGGMLNDLELREAVRLPKSQLENALVQIAYNWKTSGIGQFAGNVSDPESDFSYFTDNSGTGPAEEYVLVTTTIQVRPLLPIPFIPNVPGLSAPSTYTYSGRRLMENAKFALQ